jgi:nucleotide-binding universal stress UspA family protein
MHSTSIRHVLLAIDGSRAAELALRAAASITEKAHATLHVVHVVGYVPPPAHPYQAFDEYSRLAAEEARHFLRRQVWKARFAGADEVRSYLREGVPKEEIAALASRLDADLVVVGSRGVGRIRRLAGHSVSEGIVRKASSPVLVVRGDERAWPPTKIVVGDDGSPTSAEATELATQIACLFEAEVELVQGHENPPTPITGWGSEDRREIDEALQRDRAALEERARQLSMRSRCQTGSRMVEVEGALAIQAAVEKQHHERILLVVGNRGLRTIGRALLGSVSMQVLRTTNVPILVVPRPSAGRFSPGCSYN